MTSDTSFFSWFILAAGTYAGSLLFFLSKAHRTSRLLDLMKKRTDHRFGAFAVLAAPSAMHLCFLLMLWYFPIILKNRNGGNL